MADGVMMLLPPREGLCQTCGTAHELELPHNATSLYYQTAFNMEHGRAPTWVDAMEHCTEEMRALWIGELAKLGVDVAAGQVFASGRKARARG